MIRQILVAFQFLTIIPVKKDLAANENDIAKSASFFVLVGLFQGILLVSTEYLSGIFFHHELVIAIVLLMLVLSNGGFHLDGLADTFDALAVKGDRVKKLAIMKDSTIGPIGVISIIFALALKYLALKNLSHLLTFTYYSALIMMPIMPKWAMVLSMFHGSPAREDGLGRIFINRIGVREVAVSTLVLFLVLTLPSVFFSRYMPNSQYIFYAVLLAAIYLLCRICVIFFNKKFGGLTGDTLGAISELTEIIFLLTVIVWSRLFI